MTHEAILLEWSKITDAYLGNHYNNLEIGIGRVSGKKAMEDNVPYLSHICMSRYSLGLGRPRPRWSDGETEG